MNPAISKCFSVEILKRKIRYVCAPFAAHYSRKRNQTGINGPYKVVRADHNNDDVGNLNYTNNINWELFAMEGYPFYMPGSVGPAWQNSETAESSLANFTSFSEAFINTKKSIAGLQSTISSQTLPKASLNEESSFHYLVQECPVVLRKGVSELFSSRDLKNSQLTLITLIQKPNIRKLRSNLEGETEKLAKSFVLAAQDICMTLSVMGYWADFINPFSGKPYLSPFSHSKLYDTDERFRCLDFQIITQNNCKVVSNESEAKHPRMFVGNLFTSAPPNIGYLQEMNPSIKK